MFNFNFSQFKNFKVKDVGGQFLFFFVLYLVLLVKSTGSYFSANHNLILSIYSILFGFYILSRFLFSYLYSNKNYDRNYEPSVTFVVPAKNEEDNIAETIRRFRMADYPKEKMEVIAINDGSTDGTLEQMLLIKKECENYGLAVQVLDWQVNRGKRAGMAEGVKLAKNEIIVFVDSDSFIDEKCVRELVKYFVNPKLGAVSGHTDVYNKDQNMLTRMQALRYFVAFKIYKSAESIFGTVTCCPGCCSAYRREYILPIIDE